MSDKRTGDSIVKLAEEKKNKKTRCWDGYKPVRGKKPYSKGSCEKVTEAYMAEDLDISFQRLDEAHGHSVVVRLNGQICGDFPHKAAAINYIAEVLRISKHSLHRKQLDLSCNHCDENGRRHTDEDLSKEHKKLRHLEHLALNQEAWRTSKQQARFERLHDLRRRDRHHDFDENHRRAKLQESITTLKQLLTEEDYKSFEKIALKLYKKKKILNQAQKDGKTGLQALGSEVDELKRQLLSHPVNRIEFWRNNPKLVSKLDKASKK